MEPSAVECALCLENLKDPRNLICGHTYCLACLEQLVRHNSTTNSTCPTCRKPWEIPLNDVKNLPKNYIVNKLLEHIKKPVKCKTHLDKVVCAFCICKTCEKLICLMCTSTDHKNHEYIGLDEVQTDKILREKIDHFVKRYEHEKAIIAKKLVSIDEEIKRVDSFRADLIKGLEENVAKSFSGLDSYVVQIKSVINRFKTEQIDRIRICEPARMLAETKSLKEMKTRQAETECFKMR